MPDAADGLQQDIRLLPDGVDIVGGLRVGFQQEEEAAGGGSREGQEVREGGVDGGGMTRERGADGDQVGSRFGVTQGVATPSLL